jgi:electron transfer flavoprotein alpha subunit
MGKVLVFLPQGDGSVTKPALIALTVAKVLSSRWGKIGIIGVVLGGQAKKSAEQFSSYGFEKVVYSDHSTLSTYAADTYANVVARLFDEEGCDTLVTPASSVGKDMAPRVAVAVRAGQASDIVGVNDDGSLRRPMFAGDVLADVVLNTDNKIVTVRTSAFPPAEAEGAGCPVSPLSFEPESESKVEVVSSELTKAERPELGDAEIVISGGRALQSAENFEKFIFPLADAFGGAVGASRAAVDSGYAPNDWQVGQTGKVVAPRLYVAVGISGAIQHLAGMKDSKVIVAINKDADAPIFEVADYGLVGDLFDIVPKLAEGVKKARE